MATVPKRRAGKRAAKPAPEPVEPEATEEEVLDDEETPEPKKRDTTPLPTGEEIGRQFEQFLAGLDTQDGNDPNESGRDA